MAPRRTRHASPPLPDPCWVVMRDMTRLILESYECHGNGMNKLHEIRYRLEQEGWAADEPKYNFFFASRGADRVEVNVNWVRPGLVGTRD